MRYLDYTTRLFGDSQDASVLRLLAVLTDPAEIRGLCKGSVSLARSTLMRDIFCAAVTDFGRAFRGEIHRYLCGQYSLDVMTDLFIRHVFSGCYLLDSDAHLELGSQSKVRREERCEIIADYLTPKPEINIFGYGAGRCLQEKELGERAVSQGITSRVNFYRFDPFAPSVEHICDISQAELLGATDAPRFDVITAFFALHHAEPSARCHQLGSALRWLSEDGILVIAEEGDLAPASHRDNLATRAHVLYLMYVDVVANAIIRPEWFTSTAPDIGSNFSVNYLTCEDLQDIISHAPSSLYADTYQLGDEEGFGTTLLIYRGR